MRLIYNRHIKTNANITASCVSTGTEGLGRATSPSCCLPAAPECFFPLGWGNSRSNLGLERTPMWVSLGHVRHVVSPQRCREGLCDSSWNYECDRLMSERSCNLDRPTGYTFLFSQDVLGKLQPKEKTNMNVMLGVGKAKKKEPKQ